MGNTKMNNAKKSKRDEFYTMYKDIENEVMEYDNQFKDKIVYLNCDNPDLENIMINNTNEYGSNFWNFFYNNFNKLGLKRLISTYYDDEVSYKYEYDGNVISKERLDGNGDFRSQECISILELSDIVCTNPPFSLFREYIELLMKYNKKFLIMGNNNAISYKEVFPLIKSNKIWLGYNSNKTMEFRLPSNYNKWSRVDSNGFKYGKVPAISWFTNLELSKRNDLLPLKKSYNENINDYPVYDNYNAIEVNRVANIPYDYDGIMGVPITFLTKHNPNQFEILGTQRWAKSKELLDVYTGNVIPPENDKKTTINGKETYDRIFIKRI